MNFGGRTDLDLLDPFSLLRYLKYGDWETDLYVQGLIYIALIEYPNYSIKKIVERLKQVQGLETLSEIFVRRAIRAWGWSLKERVRISKHKFSEENVNLYVTYATQVYDMRWGDLVFLDEAHFVSRNLLKKKQFGPPGARLFVIDEFPNDTRFTLTILLNLRREDAPVIARVKDTANTAADFLDYMETAAESGYVLPGQHVILDNARVHTAVAIQQPLEEIMEERDAFLVFLPAYSPEFNPCELVFSWLKCNMRQEMVTELGRLPLIDRIQNQLCRITVDLLAQFYWKCTRVLFE